MKQRLVLLIKGALLPLALLGAWQWASGQGAAAAYIFVSLGDLAHSLRDLLVTGELWVHLRASLGRALAGLLLGGSAGIVTGALMAQSPLADRLIGPLFHSIRQVPLLGLIPLLGLWVGNGDGAKLLVIAIAAFYPTVLNTYAGMRQVEGRLREVGQVLTLTRWQTLRQILLPGAMPAIVTGITHALAFAWLACLGGELLFSAGPGMGSLLLNGEVSGRMDVVLLAVLVIALLAQAMNVAFARLARLLVKGRSSE